MIFSCNRPVTYKIPSSSRPTSPVANQPSASTGRGSSQELGRGLVGAHEDLTLPGRPIVVEVTDFDLDTGSQAPHRPEPSMAGHDVVVALLRDRTDLGHAVGLHDGDPETLLEAVPRVEREWRGS